MSGPRTAVIVAAAGKGERMKSKVRKPFVLLGKEPILAYTLKALNNSAVVDEIIVVLNPADLEKGRALIKKAKPNKIKDVIAGGKRRTDSIRNGLACVSEEVDYVLVHDGCRPFVDNKIILSVLDAAETFGAAIAAVAVKPTIKQIEKGGFVAATLDRESLIDVQTPQAFKKEILWRAYAKALEESAEATDDAALVERLGLKVKVVEGSHKNIKITTPEDLRYAKMLVCEK